MLREAQTLKVQNVYAISIRLTKIALLHLITINTSDLRFLKNKNTEQSTGCKMAGLRRKWGKLLYTIPGIARGY
jgi:hypothetical protein